MYGTPWCNHPPEKKQKRETLSDFPRNAVFDLRY
jgi:hypothetical protein